MLSWSAYVWTIEPACNMQIVVYYKLIATGKHKNKHVSQTIAVTVSHKLWF